MSYITGYPRDTIVGTLSSTEEYERYGPPSAGLCADAASLIRELEERVAAQEAQLVEADRRRDVRCANFAKLVDRFRLVVSERNEEARRADDAEAQLKEADARYEELAVLAHELCEAEGQCVPDPGDEYSRVNQAWSALDDYFEAHGEPSQTPQEPRDEAIVSEEVSGVQSPGESAVYVDLRAQLFAAWRLSGPRLQGELYRAVKALLERAIAEEAGR